MRRLSLFFAIGLFILLLLFVVYFVFFRSPTPGLVVEEGGALFGEAGDFPGGSGGGTGTSGSTEFEPQEAEEVAPRLVRITEGPVALGISVRTVERPMVRTPSEDASATTTEPSTETGVEVRYLERTTGNAYSYDPDTQTITRIVNRTLPGIQEAVWTADGAYAFVRFLSDSDISGTQLETFAYDLQDPEGGYFLETGLSDLLASGTSSIVTLLPATTGSTATMARADGSAPRTVFTSPLSSLRLLSAGDDYVAYTRASSRLDGYGFLIDGTTGTFERIIGPSRGLTLLPSSDGTLVLFSGLSGTALRAGVMYMGQRTTIELPIGAMPEKCVWAADATALYCAVPRAVGTGWPDEWYQGTTQYADRIWKIDLASRVASQIIDPQTVATVDMDAVALAIDEEADFLFFTNRRDGSLWAYDL